MERHDSQVPAPRRPSLPLFRRTSASPTDLPPSLQPETPRVADLSELLADIDALRTSLQTDLTLAAAALEAGAPDLAAELVDGDLTEVRAFSTRAAERLGSLAGLDAAGEPEHELAHAEPVDTPVLPLRRRRVMAGAPLLVAAAALLGFVAGVVPERVAEQQPPATMASAAMATSFELSRLASSGASPEQLRAVAEELNDELAALVARAGDDPAAAQQAMLLLQSTSEVLARQGDSSVLRGVMAETQALRKMLRDRLPAVAQRPARPAPRSVRPVLPALPRVESQPEQRRSSAPESSAPRSTPKATPAPAPKPSPSPATPSPPADEPSPRPSQSSGGGLPGPGDLPGL